MRWQYPAKVQPLVDSQPNNTRESWEPQFPDLIDRKTLPAAARPAFTTTYVDSQSTATRYAWDPTFPDRFPDRVLLTALRPDYHSPDVAIIPTPAPSLFYPDYPDWFPPKPKTHTPPTQSWVDSQSTATRAWRPSFPDYLRQVRTPEGSRVAPLVTPFTPSAAVLANYPDWIALRPRYAPLAPFFATDFRSPLLTALAWHPTYPDRIDRFWLAAAAQLYNSRPTDIVFVAPSPTRAWAPHFPDRVYRDKVHPSAIPFFTAGTSLQIVGAVTFSYPDEVLRKLGIHPSRIPAWAAGSQLILPPTPIAWQGQQALPQRRSWRPRDLSPGSFGTFPSVVPFFGWRGSYPDRIVRPQFLAARQLSSVLGNQATKTITALSWQGRFPDRISPRLRVAWFQAVASNLDPIVNPPSPALAWKGWQPDFVRRIESVRTAAQPPWQAGLLPEAPFQTGRAFFPDQIARRRLPVAASPFQFVQITFPAPDPGLWWGPSYPDYLRPVPRPMPLATRPLDGTQEASPFVAPIAPDRLPLRPTRPTGTVEAPTVLQTIGTRFLAPAPEQPRVLLWRPSLYLVSLLPRPLLDAFCVCLDREEVIAAALVNEDLWAPALDEEWVYSAGFVDDAGACAGSPGSDAPGVGSVGGGGSGPLPPPPVVDPGGAGASDPPPSTPPSASLTLLLSEPPEEVPVPLNLAVMTAADLTAALAQAALGTIPAGSVITLAPGTYVGNWILPVHPGATPITITTAGTLPLRRITPADRDQLAILSSPTPSLPPLDTQDGAVGWKCIGLGFTQTGGQTYDLVRLGHGDTGEQTTPAQVPSNLEFDRCYLFVADDVEQRRGFGLNSASTIIRRCYVENIKDVDGDAVAAGGWNGPGPFLIDDCFLESQAENIIFGGNTARLPNCTPSDITITNCTITKRLSWKGVRPVKNLIELKHAQRVRIANNDLTNCWQSGQDGFAIVLTVANQNADTPWTTVKDILIDSNRISNVSSIIDISGIDPFSPSLPMERVTFRNNVCRTNRAVMGGDGEFCLILNGPDTLTIEQNTIDNEGTFIRLDDPAYLTPGFRCRNNVGFAGLYGIIRNGGLQGTAALAAYFSDWVFTGNVLGGLPDAVINPATFPPGNTYPTIAALQSAFTSYPTDLTFPAGSPYAGIGALPVAVLSPSTAITVSTAGTLGQNLVAGLLDWGDGTAPTVWAGPPQPSYDHAYGSPGVYLVTLQVTDDQNRTATATLAVSLS